MALKNPSNKMSIGLTSGPKIFRHHFLDHLLIKRPRPAAKPPRVIKILPRLEGK
jgi:hypothetical protein